MSTRTDKVMTRSETAKAAKATECIAPRTLRTPHPPANLIKELFAKTKVLCENCFWPRHSRIQKHLDCGIYPAHLLLPCISAAPKEWVWGDTKAERRTRTQTTEEYKWFRMIQTKFGGLNFVQLPNLPI